MPENCLKLVKCSSHILLKVIGERFGASRARVGNIILWINHFPQGFGFTYPMDRATRRAPVVQRLDGVYPEDISLTKFDNYFQNLLGFPVDSAVDPNEAWSSSLGIAHFWRNMCYV